MRQNLLSSLVAGTLHMDESCLLNMDCNVHKPRMGLQQEKRNKGNNEKTFLPPLYKQNSSYSMTDHLS